MTDTRGNGLKISTKENPFSFSALHFMLGDLASARHNYELRPRDEVFTSLDAKMCGLGNSSGGPGVLERYTVPAQNHQLHLRLLPCQPGADPAKTVSP